MVGGQGVGTGISRWAQGGIEVGERGAAGKDPAGGTGHDRLSVGREATGGFHTQLTALEEGHQGVQLTAIEEAVLLFRLADAGERQGVVALRSNPAAAAAGGHSHGGERTGPRHVTAGPLASRGPMNKCLQPGPNPGASSP